MENAKIKINLSTGEIEISGSENFVNSHLENLQNIISSIPDFASSDSNYNQTKNEPVVDVNNHNNQERGNSKAEITDIYGEWFHSFQEDLNDLDKCLITAYFIQKQSDENEFKTREVTDLLKEHGIVLSNTSASITRLKDKKLIFQTRKDGNVKYMRVSKTGENDLEDKKK